MLRQTHSDALECTNDRQNDQLDAILCRPVRPMGRTGYAERRVKPTPRAREGPRRSSRN